MLTRGWSCWWLWTSRTTSPDLVWYIPTGCDWCPDPVYCCSPQTCQDRGCRCSPAPWWWSQPHCSWKGRETRETQSHVFLPLASDESLSPLWSLHSAWLSNLASRFRNDNLFLYVFSWLNRGLGETLVGWGFDLQLQGCPTWYYVYIYLWCSCELQM